jgi:hypothetical protein
MLENLSITQTLALLIGLYFISGGIALLSDRPIMFGLMRTLAEQPLTAYLAGIMAFAIGGTILAVHWSWDGVLASVVTAVGVVALLEGVALLAARKWFTGVVDRLMGAGLYGPVTGVAIIIGGAAMIYGALA